MISLRTMRELLVHFARRNRLVLLPLLLVLLLSAVLLIVTQRVGYVAPFVYALF